MRHLRVQYYFVVVLLALASAGVSVRAADTGNPGEGQRPATLNHAVSDPAAASAPSLSLVASSSAPDRNRASRDSDDATQLIWGYPASLVVAVIAASATIVVGFIAAVVALFVAFLQYRSLTRQLNLQRETLETQVKEQRENAKQQLQHAVDIQQKQFEDNRQVRMAELVSKRRSLVIATAVELIVLRDKTHMYELQARDYSKSEVTLDAVARLLIQRESVFDLDWSDVYLLQQASIFAKLRVIGIMIDRANRRVLDLQERLKNRPPIHGSKIKTTLDELADIYGKCSRAAPDCVDAIKSAFPDYAATIQSVDEALNPPADPDMFETVSRRIKRTPGP